MPGEIPEDGLLTPNVAENAQALIDYALSHIPKRKPILHEFLTSSLSCCQLGTGPRRHRYRRRQMAKAENTRVRKIS